MPKTIDASFIDSLPPNVAVQFLERVAKSPQREAFRYPVGDGWKSVTWKEAGDDVSRMAAGLLALGVQPEQRVGIASGTRYEWILADLGVMCAGAATTTVYPSTNEEDTAYILSDSECRVVFAEDDAQIAKLTARKAELPALQKVVTFDGATDGDWVIGLADLEKLGETYLADHPGVIEETAKSISGGPAGDADLHLGHDGPAEGRPAAAQLVGLRGRGDPRPGHPQRGRPGVPLAADGALLRQGADVDPDGDRLRRRDRRSRRQDHRQPRDREADVHGRRPAHLREGPRPDHDDAGGRGWR